MDSGAYLMDLPPIPRAFSFCGQRQGGFSVWRFGPGGGRGSLHTSHFYCRLSVCQHFQNYHRLFLRFRKKWKGLFPHIRRIRLPFFGPFIFARKGRHRRRLAQCASFPVFDDGIQFCPSWYKKDKTILTCVSGCHGNNKRSLKTRNRF